MTLETLLKVWTGYLASGVEGVAGLIIVLAALQAAIHAMIVFFGGGKAANTMHEPQTENIRLQMGRWLVLALEFELGADIMRTAITPNWMDIGQLAAIATIRTLLNYFLQKEIDHAAQRQPALLPQADITSPNQDEQQVKNAARNIDHALH